MTTSFLTRLAALEAQYDGPIPHALREEARRLDALQPLPLPARAHTVPTAPPPLPPSVRIARMADLIALRTAAAGAITVDDLFAAGFSRAELEAYGEPARLLARERLAPRDVDTMHAPKRIPRRPRQGRRSLFGRG